MAGPGAILGNAVDVARKNPAIAVGALVVAFLAARFLGDNGTATDAAASTDTAADGSGGSLLGGGLGSVTYPTVPGNGDLYDSGIVTPPAPTPIPTPTPAPAGVPRVSLAPGTYTTYAIAGGRAKVAGSFKTGGMSADYVTVKTTTATLIRLTSGFKAGTYIAKNAAGLTFSVR